MKDKEQTKWKAQHKLATKVAEHLKTVPGPVVEWSDGDKLRFLVISKFAHYQREGRSCDAMHDDEIGWEVLRIADRLDKLDLMERGPMPSLGAEIGGP